MPHPVSSHRSVEARLPAGESPLVGTQKKNFLKTESDSFRKEPPLHIIRPPLHFFAIPIPTHSPTHPHPLLTRLDSRCRYCCCYRTLCTRRPVGLVCMRSFLPFPAYPPSRISIYIHLSRFFPVYHLSGAYLADATIARKFTYACCSRLFIPSLLPSLCLCTALLSSLGDRFSSPSYTAPLFSIFFYLFFSTCVLSDFYLFACALISACVASAWY